MHRTLFALLTLAALSTTAAHATIIGFDGLSGSGDFDSYQEDGFLVTDLSGTWNKAIYFGNAVPAIFTRVAGNNSVQLTQLDGGLFHFNSVEFACGFGGKRDCDVSVTGYRGGIEQFSLHELLTTTEVWTTVVSATATGAIDRLVLTLDEADSNIDNLAIDRAVATLPSPASLTLVSLALLGVTRRMRQAQVDEN